MGLTKRWISELQEQAAGGDVAVQKRLASVGLWESPEDFFERDEQARFRHEEEAITFGHGDSFDDETGMPLDGEDAGDEDFDALGLDEFWAMDSSADRDALASAGFGTDEDYGCFNEGDDFF